MSISRITSTILILAFSFSISGCATVKTHPDFAARHKEIRSIQLVPPDVEAYEITFNAGNQPLPAAIEAMQAGTYGQIKNSLEEKGYQYQAITTEDINSNPQLKSALFEMQSLYKKAIEDITANRKKQFTYSVGSSPNAFADYKPAEALLLIREEAWKKSSGQSAADVTKAIGVGVATLGMFVPRVSFKKTLVEAALIDTNLGDVLWYNVNMNEDVTEPTNKNDMMRFIKDVINPLPNSATKGGVVQEKKKTEKPKTIDKPVTQSNNFARTAPVQ